MPASKRLQSKILKTRKRLSDERCYLAIVPIGLFLVFATVITGYRITSIPVSYAIVRGDIPVLSVPLNDESKHQFAESPAKQLSKNTTTVVLDDEGNFFFGDVSAFTSELHEVRNKFSVKAEDGSPQTGHLLDLIRQWEDRRNKTLRIKSNGVLVLVPASTIPMTVLVKVMAELRYSDVFDRVVLATGML